MNNLLSCNRHVENFKERNCSVFITINTNYCKGGAIFPIDNLLVTEEYIFKKIQAFS